VSGNPILLGNINPKPICIYGLEIGQSEELMGGAISSGTSKTAVALQGGIILKAVLKTAEQNTKYAMAQGKRSRINLAGIANEADAVIKLTLRTEAKGAVLYSLDSDENQFTEDQKYGLSDVSYSLDVTFLNKDGTERFTIRDVIEDEVSLTCPLPNCYQLFCQINGVSICTEFAWISTINLFSPVR
jgi:hypothetical protein